MDRRRISGLACALALFALPLPAGADNAVSVSVNVPSDCKITTVGPLTLAFGSVDLIRNAQPPAPTAQFGVECNNGTVWHLAADSNGSAPVDITSAGYTHAFTASTVSYTVTPSILGQTSTTSLTPTNVTLTGSFATADPPVGSYSGSFVLSVMI